jgi:hypothetical protein
MTYEGYAEQKGWSATDFGRCTPGEAGYYAAELKRFGVQCSGRRFLEMGFGNGSFMRFARDSGAEIVGVEIQESLLQLARRNGYTVYADLDSAMEAQPSGSFDLLIAFDVLEHLALDEAIATLKKLSQLARPASARLIARFPNGDSPFGLPLQNGDFTHRTALGAGIIRQLLECSGWRLNYLGEPKLMLNSIYSFAIRGSLNLIRRLLERLVLSLYFGRGGPITLVSNYLLVATLAIGLEERP